MNATGEYASPGTYNVPIKAVAADDSVSYVGTLKVTVANLPGYYSISTTRLFGSTFDGGLICALPTISYSGSLSVADMPTISGLTQNGIAMTVLNNFGTRVQLEPVAPVASYPVPGQITEIIQNKYQLYSIPCVYSQ
jgi:hypothetical protein